MKAIRIHETGGPEVMKLEDLPDLQPGAGQALVKLEAVGVNFTDVGTRRGSNPPGSLPWIPGREGAGIVEAVGDGVTDVAVGDLVAYAWAPSSYAEKVVVPAGELVKVPPPVDAITGAATMIQGLTAHYLVYSTRPVIPGDSVLVHSGAGGTGLMLIQLAKRAGARVFTTVSTSDKAAIAAEAGADAVINYVDQDFEEEIMKATNGEGVQVVYDAVGKTTFEKSLRSCARRGHVALYGQSSGAVDPVSPMTALAGSKSLSRPALFDYTNDRHELSWRAGELFDWIRGGTLNVRIGGTFPLSDAVEAHRQLEGRLSTGKLILIP